MWNQNRFFNGTKTVAKIHKLGEKEQGGKKDAGDLRRQRRLGGRQTETEVKERHALNGKSPSVVSKSAPPPLLV